MPATQKKRKKTAVTKYAGLTKDQIKIIKKEKRQRLEWTRYKE